jgi:hypothetical protein
MNNKQKISGLSAFAWAFFALAGFAMLALVSPLRNYDLYDIEGGMRALNKQPVLVIGGQLAFAWAGVVLICLVLALYDWLPTDSRSLTAYMATAFGMIAGAFFLLFGLVGGFTSFDLRYIESVRSTDYVQNAYLPLTLVMNRTFAAAITVSGLWFALINWVALRGAVLPPFVSYLGIGAGMSALLGFILPGGGFSVLGLLLSALWGILAGFRLLRE